MPKLVMITDRERKNFLRKIIPTLVHMQRLREDMWELVVRENDGTLISLNVDIKTIKEWYYTEGIPWKGVK